MLYYLFVKNGVKYAPIMVGLTMKLIIIRHAEPDYPNNSLTAKGFIEAELLAKRIGSLPNVAGVFTSPIARAVLTAKPCCSRLGIEPEVLPWLQEFRGKILDPETGEERIPWDLKHKHFETHPSLFDEALWVDHPLMTTGSPSVKEVYQETCQGVDDLLARFGVIHKHHGMYACEHNDERTVILFCHMAMGMTIVGHLTKISPFALWHGFCMPPSSVTTLVTEERTKGMVSFRCFQMGDTSHLALGNEPPSRMAMYQEIFTGTDHTSTT